ncbi:MAG: MjaI family restriction endonuclease [Oscillospiraceae bacterium]
MTFTIKNNELNRLSEGKTAVFPKYVSQLINWANQNAQGTRPRVVGQLSNLFPQYQKSTGHVSINSWKEWYLKLYPYAIDTATDKILAQIENLKEAIKLIDRDMVYRWVQDLIITKTYNGMYLQKSILAKLAEKQGKTYRLSLPCEESLGIDGYVGDTPYSIKPISYKAMGRLPEQIDVKMIYYIKNKTGLIVEVAE